MTVLICDMVESTALASKLDPEELRKVMGIYLDACANAVTSLGGFIARYTGDGIVAYFGYPAALEDAAERAVRAGLEISQTIPNLAPLPDVTLHVRTGIATGLVVVGDLLGEGAAREEAVVGETPVLASRLQALAPPDGVAIAGSTRRLIEGMFELEFLGMCDLKGLPGVRPVWRVLREAASESRFDATHQADLTEVVGRESELSLLLGRWRTACEGEWQMVLLAGEAGIGKSRMCMALASRIAAEEPFRHPSAVLAVPYPQRAASDHHQLRAQGRTDAGHGPGGETRARDRRGRRGPAHVAPETIALFAGLLSIPIGDRLPRHEASPEQIKNLTLDAIDDWLVNLSRLKPVLLDPGGCALDRSDHGRGDHPRPGPARECPDPVHHNAPAGISPAVDRPQPGCVAQPQPAEPAAVLRIGPAGGAKGSARRTRRADRRQDRRHAVVHRGIDQGHHRDRPVRGERQSPMTTGADPVS